MTVPIASAPAKIILLGEHAVVYGQPAIAVPVSSLRAEATRIADNPRKGLHIEAADLNELLPIPLEPEMVDNALALTAQKVLRALNAPLPDATIRVTSSIPMASGLGSGAAVSTAVARAVIECVGATMSTESLNALIFEIEKLYHGTPSGIDNTVIVYEKPVYFVRGEPIHALSIGAPLTLLIGDTGEGALTKIAVGDVRTLYERQPERIRPVIESIGDIARQARDAIAEGDLPLLGSLMNRNHTHLQTLTVSSPTLDHLVSAALNAGALGAKLSGGGRGGNMIALVEPGTVDAVEQALIREGAARVFRTIVSEKENL